MINEKNNGEAVLNLINNNLVLAAHDVSSGGLITSLFEMTLGTNLGVKIEKPKKLENIFKYFFGEDQSRYVLEIESKYLIKVEKFLNESSIFYEKIGRTQKNYFEIEGEFKKDINDLFKINDKWYNNY